MPPPEAVIGGGAGTTQVHDTLTVRAASNARVDPTAAPERIFAISIQRRAACVGVAVADDVLPCVSVWVVITTITCLAAGGGADHQAANAG